MSLSGSRHFTFYSDVVYAQRNVIFRNLEYFRRAAPRLYNYVGVDKSSAA